MASPWLVGYEPEDAAWSPILFGSIVAVLAAVRAGGAREASALSWINSLIGVWLFVSAFRLAASDQASWNVGIAGVVVFFLAVWSASATDGRRTIV